MKSVQSVEWGVRYVRRVRSEECEECGERV